MEELLGLVFERPLWVSVVVAAILFVLLRVVGPAFAGASISGKILATAFSTLAPWVAAVIVLTGLAGEAKRRFQQLSFGQIKGLEQIKRLDWSGFEAYVAEVYRQQGYAVTRRGGKQPDGGVDLELRRGAETVLVQCKHWLNRQVPVQRVRELLGVVTAEGADRGILIGTGGFTRDAREFANGRPIVLVDSAQLLAMQPAKPVSDVAIEPAPSCPRCGKPMVRRVAKRGQNHGSSFWGCSAFPECRATLAA